ncbi:23S rRNA (guanosine-2'-O-)-methyltransferase RlmB [Polynucleobacter sp. SHI8]|jgi:23S rRNA (guanosine2251-2'-O)-methyltransferase|uniref:23S rRNA (guanosine(2251)-2'-O)-methyltransferase RlmB n=1 Tax=unclassified Polynucleobacter TaxID=2640945 RepID=UPI002492FB63|nr:MULTISPECIES: 23S rRNA (guanosine(2251)-2'-O)-methyltransferase RlmB [unclassified Polynucleobacter]BDW10921.1 23S rRNA (guanosine-2'-O-)-methyltransferase RlmB [Polynucleobacter sp. SHI2]BDW13367.1 23S rRNA (guanosine-2'-O-)-methyltransferase RlmB [Polynucleobacter sp. SHI8]
MEQQILVGFHAVIARIRQAPDSLKTVYYDVSRRDRRMKEFIEITQQTIGRKVHQADSERLRQLAGHDRHQGVVAFAEPASLARNVAELLDSIGDKKPLLLILDGVTDPHNLGACLRVADGAGADAIIVPKDRSAQLNTTVSKVASGAAETMPFVAVTNLARSMRELQEAGVWLIGTTDDAEKTLYDVDLTGPVAIVMGAEGEGMRRLTKETCDELVSIPMFGGVESLNVSVASGVCLYEAARQRIQKTK